MLSKEDKKEICDAARMNSRALEETLLTTNDIDNLSYTESENVVDMCEQIIHCMIECVQKK